MCGIFAVLAAAGDTQHPLETLKSRLVSRGPDHLGQHTFAPHASADWSLGLTSTVLALRGSKLVEQPLVDATGEHVLCWNGEAWRIGDQPVSENDGIQVLEGLGAASRSGHTAGFLRSIQGPFAFVFFSKSEKRLYFGRDRLGRRSLLSCQTAGSLKLSSVAEELTETWQEVEANGFYSVDIRPSLEETMCTMTRHLWTENQNTVLGLGFFNRDAPSSGDQLTRESPSVEQLRQHLLASLCARALNVPIPPGCTASGTRLAVLFSGGLDCTILARLVHDIVPKEQAVDLINVAFESPRLKALDPKAGSEILYEKCPDRVTGRKSFAELTATCPSRHWRFVAVNVPYTETQAHRAEIVRLLYPHRTEMDLSIGLALYFAARGQGIAQLASDTAAEAYSTTARVLLSGLGADELFGGYTRHATASARSGHAALAEELKMDISRIGTRNLGRDDRVMSHWGREVRFPFLDEELVKWAICIPVAQKCDFENGGDDGHPEGAKRVLRLLAQKLGMNEVATEKKRAIQFGARTAKMENGKTKGTTLITP